MPDVSDLKLEPKDLEALGIQMIDQLELIDVLSAIPR